MNARLKNLRGVENQEKNRLIGVVVPIMDRNFFPSIIDGIEEVVQQANFQVVILQTYDDVAKEVAAIEMLLELGVKGIMFALTKGTKDFTHFKKVKAQGIPLILFDRSNDELDVSQVIIDDFFGAYKVVEHLIKQGCKRIAHITSFQKINIYKERLRGYRAALDRFGLPYDEDLVVESNLQLEDGKVSMIKLLGLSDCPDAVFAASDPSAIGALQILKENNIRVPDQVALAGFSNEPFTMFCDPPITSVDQHCKRMGNAVAKTFLEEINALPALSFIPKKIILMPELVVRKSSIKKEVVSVSKTTSIEFTMVESWEHIMPE